MESKLSVFHLGVNY